MALRLYHIYKNLAIGATPLGPRFLTFYKCDIT